MCNCDDSQAAALTAMGHPQASFQKQEPRSVALRVLEQGRKCLCIYLSSNVMQCIYICIHFIVVSVSSASWQIEREILELEQSDEHWQVI